MRSRITSLIPTYILLCLAGALAGALSCHADTCPTCQGERTIACSACGGAGYISAPPANGLPAAYGCEACGGFRGDPYNGPPGRPGTGRVECSTCRGTGEVEHQLTPEEKRAQQEAEAYYQRGLALLAAKQYDKAIAEFENALRVRPDHQDAKTKCDEARALRSKQEKLDRSLKQALKRLADSLNDDTDGPSLVRLGDEEPGDSKGSPGLDIYRDNDPISNPQIARIMRKLDSIDVPEPLTFEEAWIEFTRCPPDDETAGRILGYAENGLAVFDVSRLLLAGKVLSWMPSAVLSTGKTLIAGMDGADLYLLKKGAACDRALRYLKDKRTSAQFANIVQALRQKKPLPRGAKPQMVSAAKAIVDPVNGYTGKRIAWNAMWSPEAKSAMLSRACIELGAELVARGTEGIVTDLIAARDPAFKSALEALESAEAALKKTKDPAERAMLEEVIKKADTILVRTYQAGAQVTTNLISGAAAEKAESGLGRKD